MERSFKNVRTLHREGLLQKKLLTRIRILTVIAAVLLLIGVYDAVKDSLHGFVCLGIVVVTFLAGMFIFSRMNKVVWDEEKEIIVTSRMDVTGFAILVLYFIFDYAVKRFLHAHYADVSSITGYIFVALGGSLLGRSVGTRIAVYRLARVQRQLEEAEQSSL